MSSREPASAIAAFVDAVSGLLAVDWSGLPALEICSMLSAVEVQRRRLAAVDHGQIAALEASYAAHELCVPSTEVLVGQLVRVTPGEAKARVSAAADLAPRRSLVGEPLAPVFAATAAAISVGLVSVEQARVIRRAVDGLPEVLEKQWGEQVEAVLVRESASLDPGQLAAAARRIHDLLDPDGSLASDRDHERRRDVVVRGSRDGIGRLEAVLTPDALAVWQTVLETLSVPAPEVDGLRDDRTPGQRRHDGFVDAGMRLLRSGGLPDAAGVPVTVLLTMTAADLAAPNSGSEPGRGTAGTAHGGRIRLAHALAMCGDAAVLPVAFNPSGGIASYGRERRLASPAQRRALAARDGGCSFPACTRPAAWSEVHHVVEWRNGGQTDIATMCLLCRFHHREHERRGWRVVMTDGVPMWISPAWIDPAQVPRRNTAHHPEINFPDLALPAPNTSHGPGDHPDPDERAPTRDSVISRC